MIEKSAIILSGGRGSRLSYTEKALLDIRGRPLLAYVIENIRDRVDEIIVSVRDRAQEQLLSQALGGNFRFAVDEYKNLGPLAGILAGLKIARSSYSLVVACDMPFVHGEVVDLLFNRAKGKDVAIPRWNSGKLEPLHAVYKGEPMIRETEKAILKGETIVLAPVFRLKVDYVNVEDIRRIDPDLKTFMNINTYEDIETLKSH